MKDLKYIKLFEAFESVKLSKTLGFIDNASRKTFLSQLKTIANNMGLPYSKYSDDYFQYLPFKKALDLNRTIEDSPCDATSRGEFPQYAVEGETCQGGRLKRRWGAGVRSVTCPVCNGTGVKPRKYNEIKWIKFWFNKDGKYVLTTGTDGKVRDQISTVSDVYGVGGMLETPQAIGEYREIGTITRTNDFRNFPNGSFIHIRIESKTLIGRIWNDRGGSYIIQNRADGGRPDYSNGWERYGRYSWQVNGGDYQSTPPPKVLIPNSILDVVEDEDEKIDPYTWNALFDDNRLILRDNSDMKSKLSDAHFALVLDYLELKKSGFKTKGQISSEREEIRKGASAFISDDDVRKTNINRYSEELGKRIQITPELTNIGSLIFRFFGHSKFGYYVLRERHFSDFNTVISYLYRYLTSTSESDKKDYHDQIVHYIKRKSEVNTGFNIDAEKIFKDGFKKTSDEKKKLFPKIEELNKAIYDRFKSFELNTIDDIELFYNKMQTLRNIWRNSDRFQNTRKIFYLIENMTDEYRVDRYLSDISDSNVDTIIQDLDRFISIVKKV